MECYLCNSQLDISKSLEIPLTSGGKVKVHNSCMEFYLSQTSKSAAACGSCTGGKGCC
ncbi:MAG: hypothetical protein ACPHM3_04280 [Candidatus Kariarchaeum pelagius]